MKDSFNRIYNQWFRDQFPLQDRGEPTPQTREIRSAYSTKKSQPMTFNSGDDRTKQSFKDECDVNNIMARYTKTGLINFQQKYEPRYGDVTSLEFQAAMQTVARGKSMFQELPAHVRDRFKNDPTRFLEFIHNPANEEEARELGLLKPKTGDTMNTPNQGEPHELEQDRPGTQTTRLTGSTMQADRESLTSAAEGDREETTRAPQPKRRR